MAMFQLEGFTFPSKKALHLRLQQCLHRVPVGALVDGEDGEILKLLVQRHRAADELIGCGLVGVVVGTDSYGGSNFQALRSDGTQVAFSYPKTIYAISPETDYKSRVNRAFRYETLEQIKDFKRKAIEDGQVCPRSGVVLQWGTTDVDHIGKEFAELREEFLKQEGLDILTVQFQDNPSADSCSLVDRELAARWIAWHGQHAQLVALHRDAHRTKDGAHARPLNDTYLKGSPKARKNIALDESESEDIADLFANW